MADNYEGRIWVVTGEESLRLRFESAAESDLPGSNCESYREGQNYGDVDAVFHLHNTSASRPPTIEPSKPTITVVFREGGGDRDKFMAAIGGRSEIYSCHDDDFGIPKGLRADLSAELARNPVMSSPATFTVEGAKGEGCCKGCNCM